MTLGSTNLGFSNINSELGRTSTTQFSLNDSESRKLGATNGSGQNQSSGTTVYLSNLRGKSRSKVTFGSTQVDTNAYDYQPNYVAGKTYTTYTINGDVVLGSSSTGGYGLTINGNSGDIIELVNNGYIVGRGGDGAGAYGGGGTGGNALYVGLATTVYNNGYIWGGGGGGGGGSNGGDGSPKPAPVGGGTGGGGAGYYAGNPGGSLGAGGGGGAPGGTAGRGGDGGGPGVDGGAGSGGGGGGAAGYYVVGGGNVTWGATGDRRGYAG
jgi:hypothetical protein